MSTTKPTWSFRDERDLRELMERKAEFDEAHRPAVRAAISSITTNLSPDMLEATVNDWIKRADTIRDALKPFDSGVRAGSPSTSG